MQNSICTFLRIYDVMYSFIPINSQIRRENVVSSYDIIPLYKLCIKYLTHLSKLMAHKLRMDAVQSMMSKNIQMSHSVQPSSQEPV